MFIFRFYILINSGQSLHGNSDPGFFFDFADERSYKIFTDFNLSSGEFPTSNRMIHEKCLALVIGNKPTDCNDMFWCLH